jgi:hypothetical protein
MPRMDRDEFDRCLTKGGRIAGQTKRRCDPPRTEAWSFRTLPERFTRIEDALTEAGYDSRADALDDAVQLLASLLHAAPLPQWVMITDLSNIKDTGATS